RRRIDSHGRYEYWRDRCSAFNRRYTFPDRTNARRNGRYHRRYPDAVESLARHCRREGLSHRSHDGTSQTDRRSNARFWRKRSTNGARQPVAGCPPGYRRRRGGRGPPARPQPPHDLAAQQPTIPGCRERGCGLLGDLASADCDPSWRWDTPKRPALLTGACDARRSVTSLSVARGTLRPPGRGTTDRQSASAVGTRRDDAGTSRCLSTSFG